MDLESGRSRGRAEFVVVRHEHESLGAVSGQQGAREMDGAE